MPYLQDLVSGEVINLNKYATIFSGDALPSRLDQQLFKTFLHDQFLNKHAAVVRADNNRDYRLIDLCSNETILMKSDGTQMCLRPLQYYDLMDSDRILIGTFEFLFHLENLIEEAEIIGSTQQNSEQSNSGSFDDSVKNFTSPKPPRNKNDDDELYVADTEDFLSDLTEPTLSEEVDRSRSDDIEIPPTQDILSELAVKPLPPKKCSSATLMETQSFSDDISEDVKMKAEYSPMQVTLTEQINDENLALETQPFIQVPPSTRRFMKQQKELKPPTRSLDEFDLTQTNYVQYFEETQPTNYHMPPPTSSSTYSKLPKKSLNDSTPPNLFARRSAQKSSQGSQASSQKLNSILLSSSEEEEEDEDENKFKDEKQTPPSSPHNIIDLSDTPELIPKIPSQLLMNPAFLDRINTSQPIQDDTILDFKQEEEEVRISAQLTSRTSFKRHAKENLSSLPKKRFKMKYASDDDDD